MAKNYYIYNPETDNFERVFVTPAMRILRIVKFLIAASIFGFIFNFISFHWLIAKSEKELRAENAQLRSQYNVLGKRLDYSLNILSNIQNRDDNFYRVIMQMDPVARSMRYAGIDNDEVLIRPADLSDESLILTMSTRMDLLERQLYAQSISFNQLKDSITSNNQKLASTPSIIPVKGNEFTLASGYGYRRDPIDATRKFHHGVDFAAPVGTQVIASADGTIKFAGRKGAFGNQIEIVHGNDFSTTYSNLNKILVKAGSTIKRGDVIGLIGSSGKSIAPHLHYEVYQKGESRNPVNFFFMDLDRDKFAEMIQLAEDAANVLD